MLPISPRVYRPATLVALIALFGMATGARVIYVYGTANNLTQDYIDAVRSAHIIVPPEYVTRWGCVDPNRTFDLYREHSAPAPVTVGDGAVVILKEWHPPQRIVFAADVKAADAGITVRQCYVPAWKAFDSGKPAPLRPVGPDGLIGVTLSQGLHTVEIRLTETPSMAAARLASAISLALCCLLLMNGVDAGLNVAGRMQTLLGKGRSISTTAAALWKLIATH